jgi:cellulase
MKLLNILVAAAMSTVVAGHTYVWGIDVNGKSMGRGDSDGGYIRKIYNNDPVKDLTSQDMTCNRNKGPAVRTVDLKGGDQGNCCLMSSTTIDND